VTEYSHPILPTNPSPNNSVVIEPVVGVTWPRVAELTVREMSSNRWGSSDVRRSLLFIRTKATIGNGKCHSIHSAVEILRGDIREPSCPGLWADPFHFSYTMMRHTQRGHLSHKIGIATKIMSGVSINKYVGLSASLYCRSEMYAGRVACCPRWLWVTVSMPMGQADRQTRLLHYALRYRRRYRNNYHDIIMRSVRCCHAYQ